MKPKVFISAGTAATRTQADAVDAIFRSLETAGLAPRQMERNEWTAEQPLRGIKRIIGECDGVVVIAYTRYSFPFGVERQKNGEDRQLADVCITTVWNQIEAAIGYSKDLPLLVIAEHGLLSDGLLEGRYDWKVYWTDFTPEQLRSDAFLGYLESWKQLVTKSGNGRRANSNSDAGLSDVSKISITQLVGHLTVPQIWAVISTLLATLAAVATGGYRIGGGHWPWSLP